MASKYCGGEEEEWEVTSVRRFHRLKESMSRSATNANCLHQTYTNQVEFLIYYFAHGHLLNGSIPQSSGKQEISSGQHRLFYQIG